MTASWGPPQFALSLIFVCFVPTDFRSLKGISQYQSHFLNKFLKYVLKDRINTQRNKSSRFKTWMEFVRQILMKLKTSSNEGLLMKVFSHSLMWLSKHCSGHYVTTQACTLISRGCVHLRWCGSLADYTLWGRHRFPQFTTLFLYSGVSTVHSEHVIGSGLHPYIELIVWV